MPRPLTDYVEVAERVEKFFERYPEGALEPYPPGDGWKLIQAQGFDTNGDIQQQTFIVFTAAAYRKDNDPHPGIGTAWEIFPGRTNFTRGSEMQNAETSAWGRALAALGIETKRGIASREEVRNRMAEGADRLVEEARALRRKPPEVDANGAATQAEITRMSTGPEPGVERFKAGDVPVDDRWTTDAPSWLVGVDPPEDQPGSVLPAQRSQIMAVYTALGIKDRQARLDDISNVLWPGEGCAISSTNDLSYQQAARLLENLHERHTGKMTRR